MLDDDARQKRATNPLRVFDVKNREVLEALADAPKIGDALCDECRAHFEAVQALSRELRPSRSRSSPTLVRGLDYYTRTAFEFVDEAIGAQSSICGGGRYDGLIEQLGGKPTPGIGFGAGIERLLLSLEAAGVTTEDRRARRLRRAARLRAQAARAAVRTELRRSGLRAEVDYAGRSLKGQLTHARRLGRDDDRRVGAGALDRAPARSAGRGGSDGRARGEAEAMRWRDLQAGELAQGARRAAARPRRLGGNAARPRRARLHRPARRERPRAARDQPRARAGGGQGRARGPQRVRRSAPRARSRPARPRRSTRISRRARSSCRSTSSRSSRAPSRCRSSSTRRTWTRRCGCATASSTCAASGCSGTCASRATVVAAIRRVMDEQGFVDVWTPNLTQGRPRRAPATSSCRCGSSPAASSRCRSRRSSSSRLLMVAGFDRYYQIATLLPGRGSPRRPAVRVPPARRRDGRSRRARTSSSVLEGAVMRVVRGARPRRRRERRSGG